MCVCSIRQWERRVEKIGAIFDTYTQIGPFFMGKKMFFKPDRRNKHGRKCGKTPEKGLIKCGSNL